MQPPDSKDIVSKQMQFDANLTVLAADSPKYTLQRYNILYASVSVLLLLLSVHLYSALSLQIPNALHALCQYLANRKHLSDRLK